MHPRVHSFAVVLVRRCVPVRTHGACTRTYVCVFCCVCVHTTGAGWMGSTTVYGECVHSTQYAPYPPSLSLSIVLMSVCTCVCALLRVTGTPGCCSCSRPWSTKVKTWRHEEHLSARMHSSGVLSLLSPMVVMALAIVAFQGSLVLQQPPHLHVHACERPDCDCNCDCVSAVPFASACAALCRGAGVRAGRSIEVEVCVLR